MRTPLRALSVAICVLTVFLSAAAATAQSQPAAPALPTFAGQAQPQHIQQMANYITFWAGALRDSQNDANAILARDSLVLGYVEMDKQNAGYNYAERAAAILGPILAKGLGTDALSRMKEVNLASAVAQMPQASIQPALDAMVAYAPNPAVRYFGWKGYAAARTRILALGAQPTQKAMASLDKAAATETSGPVLEQIFRMTELDAARPTAVPDAAWTSAANAMLGVLNTNAKTWCQKIIHGDDEIADACRRQTIALKSYAAVIAATPAQKTAVLQTLVDLAFCAAKAYGYARAENRSADAMLALMEDCEKALQDLTGIQKPFLAKPLSDPKLAQTPEILLLTVDPVAKENRGVLAWSGALKDQGVKDPSYERAATNAVPGR